MDWGLAFFSMGLGFRILPQGFRSKVGKNMKTRIERFLEEGLLQGSGFRLEAGKEEGFRVVGSKFRGLPCNGVYVA